MWKCQKCGEAHEDVFDSCWRCGTASDGTSPRFVFVSEDQAHVSTKRDPLSAIPYAVLVPILVVIAQSAWVVQGWNFRHNALLAGLFHPVILGGMAVIAVISFFIIRPFVDRALSRWIAFLSCVAIFTITIELCLPKLAE